MGADGPTSRGGSQVYENKLIDRVTCSNPTCRTAWNGPDAPDVCPECGWRGTRFGESFQFTVDGRLFWTPFRRLNAMEIKSASGVPFNYNISIQGSKVDYVMHDDTLMDMTVGPTFYSFPQAIIGG